MVLRHFVVLDVLTFAAGAAGGSRSLLSPSETFQPYLLNL